MKAALQRHLSKRDLGELLTYSYNSIFCDSEKSLKNQILELKNLVPFGACLCAHGHIPTVLSSPVPDVDILDISYPNGYLDNYFENAQHLTDAVLMQFLKTEKPVNWYETDVASGINYPAAVNAIEFGMKDGWTYGHIDKRSICCTTIYLGGEMTDTSQRARTIVEYIIPFFSKAYLRVIDKREPIAEKLTPREAEVLNWIKEGKSSWEISVILRCSKRTVDFHVTNIKQKLNAVNRTQAVVNALHHGYIEF